MYSTYTCTYCTYCIYVFQLLCICVFPAVSSEVLNLVYTEVTDTTIGLQWVAPEFPNGPITHYIITYNGLTENTTNESTTFTLTDLEPFTNYTINVAAVNGVGVGNASNDITVLTAEGGQLILDFMCISSCMHILYTASSLNDDYVCVISTCRAHTSKESNRWKYRNHVCCPPVDATCRLQWNHSLLCGPLLRRNDIPDGLVNLTAFPSRHHHTADIFPIFQYLLHICSSC